jgi:hypothetical protein
MGNTCVVAHALLVPAVESAITNSEEREKQNSACEKQSKNKTANFV